MASDESFTASSSKQNPCPICLSKMTQESYLDQCFHAFCYRCIKKWAGIVAAKDSNSPSSLKCPMCKTENFSIIYENDGISFRRDYFGNDLKGFCSDFFSEAHKFRLKCYYSQQVNLTDELNVSRYWTSRKYQQQNKFIHYWLKREIQAVLQDEDVDIIVHHIVGVIDTLRRGWLKDRGISFDTARKEFKSTVSEAIEPFLTGRTERFVDELELFLASGLCIKAFDEVYAKHLGSENVEVCEDDDEKEAPPLHECVV